MSGKTLMTLTLAAVIATAGCNKDKDGGDRGDMGAGCSEDADCVDGLTCFLDVTGGYCTLDCTTAACPDGSTCSSALGTRLCMPGCTIAAECADGLSCVGGACVPGCEADTDCGDAGSGFVCENGGCVTPTTIVGEVFDSDTLEPIEGARVVVIDNDTMAAAAPVAITDAGGNFSQRVVLREDQESMGFTLSVAAEGYMPFPDPPLRPAIPEQVFRFTTSDTVPVALIHDASLEGLGSIAGTVALGGGTGLGGFLVIAAGTAGNDMSTVSDVDGSYVLLNVPDGTWNMAALMGGYSRGSLDGVEVAGGADVIDADMTVEEGTAGSVSGSTNFVAGGTPPASVVLFYPGTLEAVPGLRVMTDGNFVIEDVPDGTYDVYATYDNDCNVQDPDSQLAHTAIQRVTVAGAPIVIDTTFNVTDALPVTGIWGAVPCVHDDNSILVVTFEPSDVPIFTWEDYPGSTQGYAIEVIDVFGNVAWGGFETDGTPLQRFDPHVTEATYAGDPLQPGYNYRWSVWALANDSGSPLGFRYISQTENLRGLFEIRRPIE